MNVGCRSLRKKKGENNNNLPNPLLYVELCCGEGLPTELDDNNLTIKKKW
jgi:hypothetical protein